MPMKKGNSTTKALSAKGRQPRRADREPMASAKGGEKDNPWLSSKATAWYMIVALSVITAVLLSPNLLTRVKVYELGDVAERDIKAKQDFLLENKELAAKNRQAAVKSILPVYDLEPSAGDTLGRIQEAWAEGRAYLAERSLANTENRKESAGAVGAPKRDAGKDGVSFQERFFDILDVAVNEQAFDLLARNGFSSQSEQVIDDLVSKSFRKGIVSNKAMLLGHSDNGIVLHDLNSQEESTVKKLERFLDLQESRTAVLGQEKILQNVLGSPELAKISVELAANLIRPNITFNKRETELRKDLARKSVKPFYFKVKKGEMIVREGERITEQHILKLFQQQKFLKSKKMLGRIPAIAAIIGFLMAAVYLVGLMSDGKSVFSKKDLVFNGSTLMIVFLMVLAAHFMADETARSFPSLTSRALFFAIPATCGAMLISVFQGLSLAASFSLIASVLTSFALGGSLELFVYFFVGSLVAAHGVRHCHERGIFIKTALKVGGVNVILALAIQALQGSVYSLEAVTAMSAAFIGGMLAGVVASGILPLVEMAFSYTSDIKLLELAGLDQPLLRQLMVQAPGTYHHSVIVSNMVEASAQAVHANPLLAKVAAYYHDIGKMKKPLYFVENQIDRENKHSRLAPSMSSLILISHVKDGVDLAKKQKLGKEIVDIIQQHHGTSLITYFFERAREQKGKKGSKSRLIKEEDFRYPGPKPQTKEAGLVMLADVVEAASRTVAEPTAARIQGMVQKIINKVFSDGQLDECELTLKDLHEIAKSFNKTLGGILHQRVDYPEPVTKIAGGKKGLNGNSYQPAGENSGNRKPRHQEEAQESLRRLGLSR